MVQFGREVPKEVKEEAGASGRSGTGLGRRRKWPWPEPEWNRELGRKSNWWEGRRWSWTAPGWALPE